MTEQQQSEHIINAQPRTVIGKKVKRLRNDGLVPIIVFGPRVDPIPLQVPYRELEIALMKAGGTNLIDMVVEEGETYNVLARDVQRDPIKGTIKHVDFFAIDENARVVIDVPINIFGESRAVINRKGIMLTGPTSLRIEMRATNMTDRIDVDLSNFPNVGDSYYVRDLDLGEGRRVLNDPDEMILRIAQSSAARREEGLAKAAATGTAEEGEM